MKFLSDMMRTAVVVAALLFICLSTSVAAVPSWINYQGMLTYPDGTPMDTTIDITFKLYPETWSISPIWDEIHTVTTVNGIYSAHLGGADPMPQDFFDDGSMWLGIQVGTDAEMTPRMSLTAVPYAYRIGTVDEAQGGTISSDVVINGKLNVGTGNTNAGTNAFVTGATNAASGDFSVVAGGQSSAASGLRSTVSGGFANTASGVYSTVGGGRYNTSSLDDATVAGGNRNDATNYYATVSGGGYNHARGQFSVIAGGGGDAAADSNSAQGNLSVIGGGYHNYATGDASTIAGGYYHTASGGSATIGGGYRNTSTNSYSTVGGGTYNDATGQYATIAGGRYNDVAGNRSTIGGGDINQIYSGSDYSAIAGGHENQVNGDYSTIAGGDSNAIWGPANYATVGGGRVNGVSGDFSGILSGRGGRVSGIGSVICGGDNQGISDSSNNIASDLCFIGGGVGNVVDSSSRGSAIVGGSYNYLGFSQNAVIGGGLGNYIYTGLNSTIPGGYGNEITGNNSFACGTNANVTADHAFVFGDGTETFGIGSDYTVNFLCNGGFRIWTDNPVSSNIGVRVVGGGTSWVSLCDSTTKTNRVRVDGEDVLNKLSAMPIDQWNYKHQPDGPLHIGPMAQDFWNAFRLGTDSLGIETIDADGVLFAAVKELINKNQELEQRVKLLEAALLQLGLNKSTESR